MLHKIRFLTRALVFTALASVARPAHAATYCGGESTPTSFIFLYRYLYAGTNYTITTSNVTGDTVMHLLRYDDRAQATEMGLSWVQVAWNDDGIVNSLASVISFKPSTSGSYAVLVRAYSSTTGGLADLNINGTRVLTQNAFGGHVWTGQRWALGEEVRVTSTRRYEPNDQLLFLLSSNGMVSQSDDDFGPNLDSKIYATTTATSSSRIVWGSYPGKAGSSRLTVYESPNSSNDADGDLVTDALETKCGMDTTTDDSDHDAIPDSFELFGNNGFSYSLGSQWGDSHKRRNIYVELDRMVDPTNSAVPTPHGQLVNDVTTVFNTDGQIDIYFETGGATLPYTKYVSLNDCGSVSKCETMTILRAYYFAPVNSERNPYFRYMVYADGLVYRKTPNDPPTAECNSGASDGFGSNMVITLGKACLATPPTRAEQRGTVVHELGHNLGLSHNGNDDPEKDHSIIHQSVMNYRYQLSGIPSRTGALSATYSFGAGGCAACATSPKQRCFDAVVWALLWNSSSGTTYTCQSFDPKCDCDVDEWGKELTVDFVSGTRPSAGAPGASTASGPTEALSDSVDPALGHLSAAEQSAVQALIEANRDNGDSGVLKATGPTPWRGTMPDLAESRRVQVVRQQVQRLTARGLVEDLDFEVSADGRTLIEHCL